MQMLHDICRTVNPTGQKYLVFFREDAVAGGPDGAGVYKETQKDASHRANAAASFFTRSGCYSN